MNCKKQLGAQRRWTLAVWALSALVFLGACGPRAPKGLRRGPEMKIAGVQDDARLKLSGGGVLRLAAIDFPKGAGDAVALLKRDALGRPVRLYFNAAERDASGAMLGHAFARNEAGGWIWLEKTLVEAGAARVAPQAADSAGAIALLPVEQTARSARKGLWADLAFAVREPDAQGLAKEVGAYVIVEGKVTSTGRAAHRVFLNFGADYKTDFTVSVPQEAWIAWPGGAPFLLNLKGETVRVRGVLNERNGPSLEAISPAQLELTGAR